MNATENGKCGYRLTLQFQVSDVSLTPLEELTAVRSGPTSSLEIDHRRHFVTSDRQP